VIVRVCNSHDDSHYISEYTTTLIESFHHQIMTPLHYLSISKQFH
jgi:hypothetical protein